MTFKSLSFDGGVFSGRLSDPTFSRATASVNADGSTSAANAVRIGKPTLIADAPEFSRDIATASNHRFMAAGLSRDNVTRVRGLFEAASGELQIFIDDDLTPTRTIDCLRADDGDEDLAANLSGVTRKANTRYVPRVMKICSGYMAVACRRDVDTNSDASNRAWSARGVSVLVSQDDGVTWSFLQHVDDGDDPAGEAGANGLGRLNVWALSLSPLEVVDGIVRKIGVNLVDYQVGATRDGLQLFFAEVSRSTDTGSYTERDLVTVLSITGGDAVFHGHSAYSFTSGGDVHLLYVTGDTIGNQSVAVQVFSLATYDTALSTTRTLLHGGSTDQGDAARSGNQSIGFVPGPDDFTALSGVDDACGGIQLFRYDPSGPSLEIETVYGLGSVDRTDLIVTQIDCFDEGRRAHYVARVHPVGATSSWHDELASRIVYSPDGRRFAAVLARSSDDADSNPGPCATDGVKLFVGNGPSVGDGVYSADVPRTRLVKPALLAGGGRNYADGTATPVGPTNDNTVTVQSRSGGEVVDPRTSLPFDEQPPALGQVIRYEFAGNVVSTKRMRLTGTTVPSGRVTARVWLRSLVPGTMFLQTRLAGNDGTQRNGVLRNVDIPQSDSWTPLIVEDDLSAATGNMLIELFVSQFAAGPADFLVVVEYIRIGGAELGYATAEGTTSADDEFLSVGVDTFDEASLVAVMPMPAEGWDATRDASAAGTTVPVLTWRQDATNYIALSYELDTKTLEAVMVEGGSTLGTASAACFPLRDDVVRVGLVLTASGLTLHAFVGGGPVVSATVTAANGLNGKLDEVWLNRDAAGTGYGSVGVSDLILEGVAYAASDVASARGWCGRPPGLYLFDQSGGDELASLALPGAGGAFSFDVAGLGLSAGSYQFGVSAVNEYGCESERALISVEIDAGGDLAALIDAREVRAEALAGGSVAVSWEAFASIAEASTRTEPAEYEIAETGDLSSVLATVAWNPTRYHRGELGPYADGLTKTFAVRASDGVVSGVRGPWVEAAAVVTDAVGPAVPDIDEASLPEGCGCD